MVTITALKESPDLLSFVFQCHILYCVYNKSLYTLYYFIVTTNFIFCGII